MPKVSIILTSYNHADYISESIESILEQTYKDFELYIIDDFSTDNSWEVIKKYNDKRIIKIRHKKNMSYSMTKDLVKKLNGEYIAIAHCDDKWEKTKLEQQVKYLDNNKNIAACFTHVKFIDENGLEVINAKYADFNVKNKSRLKWLNHFFYYGNCLCHPSILLRKSIQLNENLFIRGLGSLPDLYRWTKLCLKHDIHIIPKKLTCFRIRDNGINTSGYNKSNIIRLNFDMYEILSLYKNIKDKEEFLTVFPDAKKYVINDDIDIDFALAKICIEYKLKPYNLFGFNLLFEIIQNDKKMKKIEKLYNYTVKDFKNETSSCDIFNTISKDDFQNSTLFYSIDNQFTEKLKDTKSVFIFSDEFIVSYKNIPGKYHNFRFDPDEGNYRVYCDLSIIVNGKEVPFTNNSNLQKENQYYFLTVDPMFFFKFDEPIEKIVIKGKTRILSHIEIDDLIKEKEKQKGILKMINKIKGRVK